MYQYWSAIDDAVYTCRSDGAERAFRNTVSGRVIKATCIMVTNKTASRATAKGPKSEGCVFLASANVAKKRPADTNPWSANENRYFWRGRVRMRTLH
jgi:hypothetical protein